MLNGMRAKQNPILADSLFVGAIGPGRQGVVGSSSGAKVVPWAELFGVGGLYCVLVLGEETFREMRFCNAPSAISSERVST